MPRYDDRFFSPPAPLAAATIIDPTGGGHVEEVPMLVDTGSDVTFLPLWAVAELGITADPQRQYEVSGFGGSIEQYPVVHVHLAFEGKTFRGQFLVADQTWGVVGRNVINCLRLVLDGPRWSWTVD